MRPGATLASSFKRPSLTVFAVFALLSVVPAGSSLATAAKLRLSVTPDQASSALAVTVAATGAADDNPTSCPTGIGCELTVFVIRSGACPAQPKSLLIDDANIVVFLTKRGLPALIGTTPGPFSATGNYFLNGAPNAHSQGNATEGYRQSRWGRFIFCGYLQGASATATFTNTRPDELDLLGHGVVRLGSGTIGVYSVRCAAPPCRIKLAEQAYAAGRHIAKLDTQSLEHVVESAEGGRPYAVAFPLSKLSQVLLKRVLTRYGSVALRFTGTVIDARGKHAVAARTVIVRG